MHMSPASKQHPRLSVAIPASLVSDVPHLREKTLKIGLIGRAAAIFRVDEIIIYPDQTGTRQNRETSLIATVLSYMETPQYLRKLLFKISPELRYAGILPPLRTPHHPTQNRKRDLKNGEFREGVAISVNDQGALIEIGVGHPIPVPNMRVPLHTRVTVKIVEAGKHPKAVLANPDDIKAYWGYKVTASKVPLGRMLKEKPFDLFVATSRLGEPVAHVAERLAAAWKKSENALVAFGSPTEGLHEIVSREGLNLDHLADFVVNTIPQQATETVRTEEAFYATLAVLNVLTGGE